MEDDEDFLQTSNPSAHQSQPIARHLRDRTNSGGNLKRVSTEPLSRKPRPNSIIQPVSTCSICWDAWEAPPAVHCLVSLFCGHLFGESCIHDWLLSRDPQTNSLRNYCPTCKKRARVIDIRRIYAPGVQIEKPMDSLSIQKAQSFDRLFESFKSLKENHLELKSQYSTLSNKYEMLFAERQAFFSTIVPTVPCAASPVIPSPSGHPNISYSEPLRPKDEEGITGPDPQQPQEGQSSSFCTSQASPLNFNLIATLAIPHSTTGAFVLSDDPALGLSFVFSTPKARSSKLQQLSQNAHSSSPGLLSKSRLYKSKPLIHAAQASNINKCSLEDPIHTLETIHNVHSNRITRLISPGSGSSALSSCIISSSIDKTVAITSVPDGKTVYSILLPSPVFSLQLDSHNPFLIYSGLSNGQIIHHDIRYPKVPIYSIGLPSSDSILNFMVLNPADAHSLDFKSSNTPSIDSAFDLNISSDSSDSFDISPLPPFLVATNKSIEHWSFGTSNQKNHIDSGDTLYHAQKPASSSFPISVACNKSTLYQQPFGSILSASMYQSHITLCCISSQPPFLSNYGFSYSRSLLSESLISDPIPLSGPATIPPQSRTGRLYGPSIFGLQCRAPIFSSSCAILPKSNFVATWDHHHSTPLIWDQGIFDENSSNPIQPRCIYKLIPHTGTPQDFIIDKNFDYFASISTQSINLYSVNSELN